MGHEPVTRFAGVGDLCPTVSNSLGYTTVLYGLNSWALLNWNKEGYELDQEHEQDFKKIFFIVWIFFYCLQLKSVKIEPTILFEEVIWKRGW